MKKSVMTCAALAMFASIAEARDLPTSTVMVTGDTNVEYTSDETNYSFGSSTTDVTKLNLSSVYFVAPNVGVGLMVGSEESKTSNGLVVSKESMTMVGPIFGYNISLNPQASLMIHAGYFLANGDNNDGMGASVDLDGDGVMLGGMFNYFINDNVALNLGLRRVKADIDIKYNGTTESAKLTETGATVGMALFF